MAANQLEITEADNGSIIRLTGDMEVVIDITPTSDFELGFVTYSVDSFTLKSNLRKFRQLDGSFANTLQVGGKIGLSFMLMFNMDDQSWDITINNLIAQGAVGSRPEVLLVPDANGVITPDGNVSNRFRFLMDKDLKLADPINYSTDQNIYLAGFQDPNGGHKLTFGVALMLPGALPYVAPTGGGAAFKVELQPTLNPQTNSLTWFLKGDPDNVTQPAGFGLATEVMQIAGTNQKYFAMRDGMGAMGAMNNGTIAIILRNCTSSEATGALVGTDPAKTFYVVGAPVINNGADQRPIMKMPTVDYGEGPPRGANRPAYGKAILNFEGKGTVIVRDLRITGARNYTNNAHGLCNNADAMNLIIQNVEITDCNNGVLNGNQGMTGNTEYYDVRIDMCGVGGPDPENSHGSFSSAGFTHSIYMGHNNATIKMARCSLTNSVNGDNLKCRTGTLLATQVLCSGAAEGRELEIPNGGVVIMDNCSFIKPASSNNGHLVIVGGNGSPPDTPEGCDTSRPRKYQFTNCLFQSGYDAGTNTGKDGFLFCNLDPSVPVEFIDCKFVGPLATSNASDPNGQPAFAGTTTVGGIRYFPNVPPIYTYTGGPNGTVTGPDRHDDWTYAPLGPVKPVGYFPIPMSPING